MSKSSQPHHRIDDDLHLVDQLGEEHLLQIDVHPSGLDLGQIEDVVDEAEQVLAGGLDLGEVGDAGVVAAVLRILDEQFAV